MKTVKFPYGKEMIEYDFSNEKFLGTLTSSIHGYEPKEQGIALVKTAMKNPIGSPRLYELAKGKKKIVLIASDHTRPVPSRVIVPPMLEEIRAAEPDAEITILIATGCHRNTTKEELIAKFGEEIVENECIEIHVSTDEDAMVHLGTLPSGGALRINRIAAEADLLISEGFIEPHFFAGFSGGRKSVLPGIASRETVLANHCAEFIDHPRARTGILDGNPIHADMLFAAKAAKLAYVVNVVINEKKEAIYAVAGDAEAAHRKGCEFLSGLCQVKPLEADIAITTNGGYPLDQNIYQSVKGMTAAEATVKKDGVIIMLSRCNDGHGGESFYHQLADEPDIAKSMAQILSRSRGETVPDQWEAQILLRILLHAKVIFVSDAPKKMIEDMHMIPAESLEEALTLAKKLLNNPHPTVTAIPDGVSVMVVGQ
ncbi:MAG: nickel-dependent lactate racemase [Ruminococcaceae bacterium]|nr:nickel-dependent lactate racemase [Oscillospiraceae bacterium]